MENYTYRYTYRAEYSRESDEYVGLCLEFPRSTAQGPTAHQAITAIERVIEEVCAEMRECGSEPPVSLGDRRYSGSFVVRTSPELHRRLVVEAVEQGVSLNHWVIQKLAGRSPTPSLDDLF